MFPEQRILADAVAHAVEFVNDVNTQVGTDAWEDLTDEGFLARHLSRRIHQQTKAEAAAKGVPHDELVKAAAIGALNSEAKHLR